MVTADILSKFIGAHGIWKLRLRQAIDSGSSEFVVGTVSKDSTCKFGQWLYALPLSDRQSKHWKTVQELHARFHIEAANVLDLALKGKKQEAEHALDHNSAFAGASSSFTLAMMKWKSDIS